MFSRQRCTRRLAIHIHSLVMPDHVHELQSVLQVALSVRVACVRRHLLPQFGHMLQKHDAQCLVYMVKAWLATGFVCKYYSLPA